MTHLQPPPLLGPPYTFAASSQPSNAIPQHLHHRLDLVSGRVASKTESDRPQRDEPPEAGHAHNRYLEETIGYDAGWARGNQTGVSTSTTAKSAAAT